MDGSRLASVVLPPLNESMQEMSFMLKKGALLARKVLA